MRRALAAVVLAAGLTACASGQEPGLDPPASGGTVTTSRTLDPCPPGGPDASTPPAGCLDESGAVVHP